MKSVVQALDERMQFWSTTAIRSIDTVTIEEIARHFTGV